MTSEAEAAQLSISKKRKNLQKKEGTRKYQRKTKRFTWPESLHRLFVASIFEGIQVHRVL